MGAKARDPIQMLGRVVHLMEAPQEGHLVVEAVRPVHGEVKQQHAEHQAGRLRKLVHQRTNQQARDPHQRKHRDRHDHHARQDAVDRQEQGVGDVREHHRATQGLSVPREEFLEGHDEHEKDGNDAQRPEGLQRPRPDQAADEQQRQQHPQDQRLGLKFSTGLFPAPLARLDVGRHGVQKRAFDGGQTKAVVLHHARQTPEPCL